MGSYHIQKVEQIMVSMSHADVDALLLHGDLHAQAALAVSPYHIQKVERILVSLSHADDDAVLLHGELHAQAALAEHTEAPRTGGHRPILLRSQPGGHEQDLCAAVRKPSRILGNFWMH